MCAILSGNTQRCCIWVPTPGYPRVLPWGQTLEVFTQKLLPPFCVQYRGAFTGGNLTPGRSSSLFSPEERGTMLSSASAGCLRGRQHHCHSQGTGSLSCAPAAGAGGAQRHQGLPCCSMDALEVLQLPRPCSLKSSSLRRARKTGTNRS